MNTTALADLLLVAAAVVWILIRQLATAPVKQRALVIVPLVLAYFGVKAVPLSVWTSPVDAALVGAGVLAAVGLGVARGRTIRVWRAADGLWWRRGSRVTLALWIALFAVRGVLVVADRAAGHPEASGLGVVLVSLAVSFGAQNGVVLWRVLDGRPSRAVTA